MNLFAEFSPLCGRGWKQGRWRQEKRLFAELSLSKTTADKLFGPLRRLIEKAAKGLRAAAAVVWRHDGMYVVMGATAATIKAAC